MPDRNGFLPVSVPQIRAHSPGSEQALNYHSHTAYHASNGLSTLKPVSTPTQGALY